MNNRPGPCARAFFYCLNFYFAKFDGIEPYKMYVNNYIPLYKMYVISYNKVNQARPHGPGKDGRKMATMIERKVESIRKELEKLYARKERELAKLAKKTAAAEKVGANCTREEWFAGMREQYSPEQANAWFEKRCAERDVEETCGSIANAEKRLAKYGGQADAAQEEREREAAEVDRIGKIEARLLTPEQQKENAARRKAEYEKWLAEFKAECLKDGIIIDTVCGSFFSGTTKGGKRFSIDGNCGWTVRSRHCYTLKINGETVFTSGEFFTAYRYLMKN